MRIDTATRIQAAMNRIMLMGACVVFALSACAPPVSGKWTQQELETSAHFYRSQRANKEYLRIVRGSDLRSKFTYEQRIELERQMKKAWTEALQVLADPTFLGKVHPDLRNHYRDEYVRSLELTLKNFDHPNRDVAELSDTLYNTYVEWYVDHQNEFVMPKEAL